MATKYLPAGSEVVVLAAAARRATRYTTRKEIPVVNPEATVCPLTSTPVQRVQVEGVRVWFRPEQVRERETISDEAAAKAAELKACLLIYDIPERAGIENPSGRLRRIAIRANLSCWLIPEMNIPYAMLNAMSEAGASWHVVRFDAGEGRKLIQMAIESIRKELQAAIRRAELTQTQAGAELDAAMTLQSSQERGRAEERYLKRAESIQTRLTELMSELEEGAGVFGIGRDHLQLPGAMAALEGIQTAMHARARTYADAIKVLREAGTTDAAALANGAEQTTAVPHYILADAVREGGNDDAADAITAAFTPAETD